jgi:hypothetical protein
MTLVSHTTAPISSSPLAVSKNPCARTSAIRHTADAAFVNVINVIMSSGGQAQPSPVTTLRDTHVAG